MYDEIMLSVDGEQSKVVGRVTLTESGLRERGHLQEWVIRNPEILGAGVRAITCEFDRWQTAQGVQVRDRLDVLGISPDGRPVVAELKRDEANHTVHMQAINYAAMVSRLKLEDLADLWSTWRTSRGEVVSYAQALDELQTRLVVTEASIRNPRIIIIASAFPGSVTASTVWLSERDVDMSLIRYQAYKVGEQVIVSFSRFYPVPSVEEFTIGRRSVVDEVAADIDPGADWDRSSLAHLAEQGNAATVAMMDLTSAAVGQGVGVGVQDIMRLAELTVGQVRGQLGGLTMRLKNPNYGFAQNAWPVAITWLPGGVADYHIDEALAAIWRELRPAEVQRASGVLAAGGVAVGHVEDDLVSGLEEERSRADG